MTWLCLVLSVLRDFNRQEEVSSYHVRVKPLHPSNSFTIWGHSRAGVEICSTRLERKQRIHTRSIWRMDAFLRVSYQSFDFFSRGINDNDGVTWLLHAVFANPTVVFLHWINALMLKGMRKVWYDLRLNEYNTLAENSPSANLRPLPSGVMGSGWESGNFWQYRRWSSKLEKKTSPLWTRKSPPPYSCTRVRVLKPWGVQSTGSESPILSDRIT